MPDLPSGTVTFLFSDIEGSTPLWEGEPERMRPALAQHNAILRQAIDAQRGYVFKVIGDAFQAAFARPADGLAAALAAQRELEAAAWPTSTPLRVRMGLHTGPAEPEGAEYAVAHTLNRVARIMAAAHGGQVVLSVDVAQLLQGDLPPDCRLRDLGQHRMKGMTQREHLYQLLAPGLPAAFPPLATLDAMPNNLPVQLTSFVGREREIAEVRARLAASPVPEPPRAEPAGQGWREHGGEAVRLMTLTGPGGTGKTRLSLQIAAELLPEYPDGAWLVELAPLADPALVPQSVAAALGVREQPGRPLLDALADYLRAKHLLLILDNCEHLIAACAETADHLLRAAPGVKILASSREALGIAGETAFRVPSLPAPAAEGTLSLEALGQYESVRLFVARAQAALPEFAVTQQNMLAVAQVCRRLDGIPLALELAAARVKLLRVDQIAARLDDSFRLLTGGSRTALPRQQTLRALIDWSYALLTEPERALLRRLAVFAGGWTLEAAEAAGGDGDVLDLLSRLVDKSLVVAERAPGDETRYRLLETIRQYAREKLFGAPGEAAAARAAHLAYYLALAEAAEPRVFGPDEREWGDRLVAELDNLRAALEWALDREPETALRLAGALVWFWWQNGNTRETHAWLLQVWAGLPGLPEPRDDAHRRRRRVAQAKVAYGLAQCQIDWGDNAGARQKLYESAELLRGQGEEGWQAFVLAVLALDEVINGHAPAAAAAAADSLPLARAARDPWALAFSLHWLAEYAAMAHGDLAAAQAGMAESVRVWQRMGSVWGAALTQMIWAGIANLAGDTARARQLVTACLPVFEARHERSHVAMARSELAHIERHDGHPAEARALYQQTLAAWVEMGKYGAAAHELECLAFLARAEGQGETAARLLGAAEAVRAAHTVPMNPDERPEYDREVAAMRALLDANALARAWEAGGALTLDQAVAYALQ